MDVGVLRAAGCAVCVCRAISARRFWPEGWIAVRETLNFDLDRFTPEIVARLSSLEGSLRPTDLVQKVGAVVLSDSISDFDLGDFESKRAEDPEAGMRRTEAVVRGLGKAVADDEKIFAELLPELVSGSGRRFLWSFGQG